MRRSNIGCCTIAGAVLVTLKLCGQIGNVHWFIVLLPWTFDVVASVALTLCFKRKLSKVRFNTDDLYDSFMEGFTKGNECSSDSESNIEDLLDRLERKHDKDQR